MRNRDLPRRPALGSLAFYYQPIFGVGGEAEWFEALARWELPDGTVRGPLDFLDYLLAPGQIVGFTRYCVKEATKLLLSRPDLPAVSLNLSPQQVMHPATLDALLGVRERLRTRLKLELTEQRVTDGAAYAAGAAALMEAGYALVLDDVTLEEYPVREGAYSYISGVKLDRSMLPRLCGPDADAAAERFVRTLCAQDLDVTIEGVDRVEEVEMVTRLGVTSFQGFGLGVPMATLPATTDEPMRWGLCVPGRH